MLWLSFALFREQGFDLPWGKADISVSLPERYRYYALLCRGDAFCPWPEIKPPMGPATGNRLRRTLTCRHFVRHPRKKGKGAGGRYRGGCSCVHAGIPSCLYAIRAIRAMWGGVWVMVGAVVFRTFGKCGAWFCCFAFRLEMCYIIAM